jgi:hypothetical protein
MVGSSGASERSGYAKQNGTTQPTTQIVGERMTVAFACPTLINSKIYNPIHTVLLQRTQVYTIRTPLSRAPASTPQSSETHSWLSALFAPSQPD